MSEAINFLPHNPNLLTTLKKKAFKNIVGKREKCWSTHSQTKLKIYLVVCKCFQVREVLHFVVW